MIEISFFIFIVSAGVLFVFYSLTIIVISLYKSPGKGPAYPPGISVIVCARNEISNLQQLIPSILKQNYDQFELILVDDRSTDDTYDYALETAKKHKNFKHVRIDNTPDHINNKKYAITLGVKAAKFEHLLFTDADCILPGDEWINEMSRGFTLERKVFVIGYSQYTKEPGLLNLFIRFETMLTGLSCFGIGFMGNPYMGVGRNLAYKKSFFLDKNGFGKYQGVVGGDDDLFVNRHATRDNTAFVLDKNTTVYSTPKRTLKEYIIQKTRHLSVSKYYRLPDKLLLGILNLSKLLFWLCLFIAILAAGKTIYVIGGFLLVMVSLLFALYVLKRKTGDLTELWATAALDFLYVIYYLTIGLKVLFTKKIKWK